MTLTTDYTRMHRALRIAAAEHALRPFDLRLLLAVDERDGSTDTATLAQDLGQNGSAVRRVLPELVASDFVTTAGIDGGAVRPGTRTLVDLTDAGRAIVERVRALAQPPEVTKAIADLQREYQAA